MMTKRLMMIALRPWMLAMLGSGVMLLWLLWWLTYGGDGLTQVHAQTPSTHAPAAAPSVPAPPNPVTVLRLSGCTIPPGTVLGEPTVFGDSYFASCAWGSSDETLTVWAFSNNDDRDVSIRKAQRSDGSTIIIGDKFIAVLGDACCGAPNVVTPATVAARIHGVIN